MGGGLEVVQNFEVSAESFVFNSERCEGIEQSKDMM